MKHLFFLKTPSRFFAAIFFLLISFSFSGKYAGNPSKTILLIPYQTVMHLSDTDADIADYSKLNIKESRVRMRNSITENLSLTLRENFQVIMLTEIGTKKEKNDLNNFFSSENFFLSKIDAVNPPMSADTSKENNASFSMFKKNTSPDYNASYMNVSLSKPVLFNELSGKYEADYFLVLTQLEIKTHYDECIDVANRVFHREFRLHYAVFDAQGNKVDGSFASADAGSDMNSVTKITANIFPKIVKKISDAMVLSIK